MAAKGSCIRRSHPPLSSSVTTMSVCGDIVATAKKIKSNKNPTLNQILSAAAAITPPSVLRCLHAISCSSVRQPTRPQNPLQLLFFIAKHFFVSIKLISLLENNRQSSASWRSTSLTFKSKGRHAEEEKKKKNEQLWSFALKLKKRDRNN